MQLSIDITLNNLEPGRYGADSVSRKFNIEAPGTTEDQSSVAKLLIAAQALAGYDDVITSLVDELNKRLADSAETDELPDAGQPQPPAIGPESPAIGAESPDSADPDPDEGAETAFPTRVQEAE